MTSRITPAQELVNLFREDFGLAQPKTQKVGPIRCNNREWMFTLSGINGHSDQLWIASSSRIYMPTSTEDIMSAQVATNIELSSATVALSVLAVNDIPLWIFVECAFPGIFSEEQKSTVSDPLYPPMNVRRMAASAFLRMLTSGSGFDREMITWLYDQYNQAFPSTITFPEDRVPLKHTFKCQSCHFIQEYSEPDMVVLRTRIEQDGWIFCPQCGSIAKPPADNVEATNTSPFPLSGQI